MIGIETDLEVNLNAEDVRQAHRQRLMDAATKGFAVALERAPEDRGTLKEGMFPPEKRGDSIVYGSTAPYAEPQEFGTDPYWPPAKPLVEWAQRIGKDAGFGYYVQRKIAQEGITEHPFLRPSSEAVQDFLKTHPLGDYLE